LAGLDHLMAESEVGSGVNQKVLLPVRRVGGVEAGFNVDMMPVNAATDKQTTLSPFVVQASKDHHVIFSDLNRLKLETISDPQVPSVLLKPAFSHS